MLAIAILIFSARARRRTGFTIAGPGGGGIVASDTGVLAPMLLRDPVLGIRGVPDYILENHDRRLHPVEVKPTRRSSRLYDSDRVQVGAYLIALRSVTGSHAAPFGYVRYASRTFQVDLTSELEHQVRRIVEAIRVGRSLQKMKRDHGSAARCAACAMRVHCDESLA
jgi:CRISPR/Cas system-associated exonuclease Cas4 (RecB family)